MKKVISFSLWGDSPKYTVGAIKNAELAIKYYTDWKFKYYVGSSVPNQIVYYLETFSNTEIVHKKDLGDWSSMFWRFETCYNDDSDLVIFRDTDSRISRREEIAVNEWIESDKNFHIMRDHPYHNFPILGGMWGMKKNNKYNLQLMLEDFVKNYAQNRYGTDYAFLGNILYPIIKEDCLVHDPIFENKPFPLTRNELEFIGQVFDENNNTVKEHLDALKEFINRGTN
jgi:hypothetical protein